MANHNPDFPSQLTETADLENEPPLFLAEILQLRPRMDFEAGKTRMRRQWSRVDDPAIGHEFPEPLQVTSSDLRFPYLPQARRPQEGQPEFFLKVRLAGRSKALAPGEHR